jgi:hypothetical protein
MRLPSPTRGISPTWGSSGGQPSGAEHQRRPRDVDNQQIRQLSFTVRTRVRLTTLQVQDSCSHMELVVVTAHSTQPGEPASVAEARPALRTIDKLADPPATLDP